jgi:hypothetical protein
MIEILRYETANKGKVIGYVDIKFALGEHKMIIRKIAHLQNGDRKWFNLPTFTRDRVDGSKQYFKYWQFEIEVTNGQLMEKLPELVNKFCEEQGIKQNVPISPFESGSKMENDDLPF